jgi:multidrug transporter EmrE-like cation transporter
MKTALSVALFIFYIIISCSGLSMIKSSSGWRSILFVSGFFLYAAGAVIWMIILRRLPLSFAFPIAAGSLAVGTMLSGVFFLGETVNQKHILGAVLIIFGIYLIAKSN